MKSKVTTFILLTALLISLSLLVKRTKELEIVKREAKANTLIQEDREYQMISFHCVEKAIFAYARNNKEIPSFGTNIVADLRPYLPITDVFKFDLFPMSFSNDIRYPNDHVLTSAGSDKTFDTFDDYDYPIRKSEIEAWKLVSPYPFEKNYHEPIPFTDKQ